MLGRDLPGGRGPAGRLGRGLSYFVKCVRSTGDLDPKLPDERFDFLEEGWSSSIVGVTR